MDLTGDADGPSSGTDGDRSANGGTEAAATTESGAANRHRDVLHVEPVLQIQPPTRWVDADCSDEFQLHQSPMPHVRPQTAPEYTVLPQPWSTYLEQHDRFSEHHTVRAVRNGDDAPWRLTLICTATGQRALAPAATQFDLGPELPELQLAPGVGLALVDDAAFRAIPEVVPTLNDATATITSYRAVVTRRIVPPATDSRRRAGRRCNGVSA